MLNQARIAVLVSGGGTNLEALLRAQESGALPHGRIVLVVSSMRNKRENQPPASLGLSYFREER